MFDVNGVKSACIFVTNKLHEIASYYRDISRYKTGSNRAKIPCVKVEGISDKYFSVEYATSFKLACTDLRTCMPFLL